MAASAEEEIRALRSASNEALKQHDLKAFAATLDVDLVVVAGNGGLIGSRLEYVQLVEREFADPQAALYERITDRVEISSAKPLAAEHGHWIGTRPDGSRAFAGTYLAMWRKSKAGWKIRSELFVRLN
jgi:ketosteroid isomerase-like protein